MVELKKEGQLMLYTLMNKNTPIADIKFNIKQEYISEVVKTHNPEFAPLGITKNNKIDLEGLSEWWDNRAIPDTRENVEKILEHLHQDRYEFLIQSLGLSLSDQYWVKPQKSGIEWKNVNFFKNTFSNDVGKLFFDYGTPSNQLNYSAPDWTLNGMLDKRWEQKENTTKLLKKGMGFLCQQPFNEKIASDILKQLDCKNFIQYELKIEKNTPISICKNFINENIEYIPASVLKKIDKRDQKDSEYEYFMKCCQKLKIDDLMQQYLDYALPFDYLISNVDRNYGNFGIIRNVENLEILGAAPIFDNGNSLWYNAPQITQEVKSYPFVFLQDEQIKLVKNKNVFPVEKLAKVDMKIINNILKLNKNIPEERIKRIVENTQKKIQKLEYILSEKTNKM